MKESTRFAGLFASVGFMFIAIPGYLATFNPIHALIYAILGSSILAMIGFKLGDILDHPKGSRRSGTPRFMRELMAPPRSRTAMAPQPAQKTGGRRPGLTGEETLLDDMDADL